MPRNRHTIRHAWRSTIRSTTRRIIRVRWRAPDDLGFALTCFRRAIADHRCLVRLAPRFFDSALIERERLEHEAERRRRDEWEAAIAKVYGHAPGPSTLQKDEPPPLPPPRTVAAVECALASLRFWLDAGKTARHRFQRRHPHALISFDRVLSLIDIGIKLGRLAVGLNWPTLT